MRGNWQDYCQDASRGHSAIAELLVLSALVHSGAKTQLFQAICRTAKVRAFLGRIEVRYFEGATKLRAIESVYFLRTNRPYQLSQIDPRDVRPHVHPAETGGRSV